MRKIGSFSTWPNSRHTFLEEFFSGKKMVIDRAFREFIEVLGSRYHSSSYHFYDVSQTEAGENNDHHILETFPQLHRVDALMVCEMLDYLGGKGSRFLEIPKGKDEVHLILGYTKIDEVLHVLLVEHEFEHGVDAIHLHVHPLDFWGEDLPRVAFLVAC